MDAPGKTTIYTYDNSGNRESLNETYTSAQPSDYTNPNTGKSLQYLVKQSQYVYSNADRLLILVETMEDGNSREVKMGYNAGNLSFSNGNLTTNYSKIIGQSGTPLITINFNPNTANVNNETKLLTMALANVRKHYHVEDLTLVAHSMGGIVATQYIENKGKSAHINKLITIDSPINGSGWANKIETGEKISHVSKWGEPALHDLRTDSKEILKIHQEKNSFSSTTQVYSVASKFQGKYNRNGDGIVTVQSQLGLKSIVPSANFHQKVIAIHANSHIVHNLIAKSPYLNKIFYSNKKPKPIDWLQTVQVHTDATENPEIINYVTKTIWGKQR